MKHESISPPPTKRRKVHIVTPTPPTTTDPSPASLSTSEGKDTITVYAWNINGIGPFIQKPITSFFQSKTKSTSPSTTTSVHADAVPTASLRHFLRRHAWPTLLFLQEVKISPEDTTTQRAVERAVRRPADASAASEPDYAAFFCLPRDAYNARGFGRKVYGVCSIVRRDFLAARKVKVRTVEWDLEGRIQILETHEGERLSFWNVYAVNGTENPYRDPKTGEVVGTRHDRKLKVHELMVEECLRLEREGYGVVLAGDMNVARAEIDGFPGLRVWPEQHVRNRADFNDKFFEAEGGLRAVDTYRLLHGSKKGYTYYGRGRPFGSSCDRVDLVICSRKLKENVVAAGMFETPAERGPSDHCPLYASFRFRTEEGASHDEKEVVKPA